MITKITPHQTTNKKHILAIEDDAGIAITLQMMIENRYYLTIIETAEEGLRYLQLNPSRVDLILLDNNLPGMSGLELLATLKADKALKAIPVILQSADYQLSKINKKAIIAEDLLSKPYTKQQLLEAIEKALQS